MRIIVTDRAEEKLQDNIGYIIEQFGGKSKKKFIGEFRNILKLLLKNPNMGFIEPLLNERPIMYRSIVMNRYNKIIYHIKDDVIEIVDFWDTRREPKEQAGEVK